MATIFKVLILLCTFEAILGSLQLFVRGPFLWISFQNLEGIGRASGLNGTLTFGANMLISSVLLIPFLFKEKRQTIYLLKYQKFCFCILLFGVLITVTRSQWIAVSIAFLTYYLMFNQQRSLFHKLLQFFPIVVLLITLIIMLYIIPGSFLLGFEYRIFSVLDDPSALSRISLSYAGLMMFLDNPIWGVGIGHFIELYWDYFPAFMNQEEVTSAMMPHNLMIALGAECGIFVVIVYYSFYIWSMKNFFKRIKNPYTSPIDKKIYQGLFLYVIAFFFDSLFHNYFTENLIWIVFALSFYPYAYPEKSSHASVITSSKSLTVINPLPSDA
ncbi:MAG: O-antigen ligase family protein [SAR324 cluster bacterium]|nr:O-antigen ligase family protein [SAR324 cluster bacterium]